MGILWQGVQYAIGRRRKSPALTANAPLDRRSA
jgi:hypothetical protein